MRSPYIQYLKTIKNNWHPICEQVAKTTLDTQYMKQFWNNNLTSNTCKSHPIREQSFETKRTWYSKCETIRKWGPLTSNIWKPFQTSYVWNKFRKQSLASNMWNTFRNKHLPSNMWKRFNTWRPIYETLKANIRHPIWEAVSQLFQQTIQNTFKIYSTPSQTRPQNNFRTPFQTASFWNNKSV